MKRKEPGIKDTVAKVDRLLDKHITYYDLPTKVRGAPCRVVRAEHGIVLSFADGSWHYQHRYNGQMSTAQEWSGVVLGKYNIYILDYVHALYLCGKITATEAEIFCDWYRPRRAKEDADKDLQALKDDAAALGYVVVRKRKN